MLIVKTKDFLNKITSLNGKAPKLLTRMLRYSITGTSSGFLDLVLLVILIEIIGIYYLTAAAVAFVAMHSLAYIINRVWGFSDSKAKKVNGYFYFIFFGLIGISLTLFLLKFSVETLKIHYLPSRVLVAVFVGIFNFSMNYFFTFKMKKEEWHPKNLKKQ